MKRKTLRERAAWAAVRLSYWDHSETKAFAAGAEWGYRACQADARRKARKGKGEK